MVLVCVIFGKEYSLFIVLVSFLYCCYDNFIVVAITISMSMDLFSNLLALYWMVETDTVFSDCFFWSEVFPVFSMMRHILFSCVNTIASEWYDLIKTPKSMIVRVLIPLKYF